MQGISREDIERWFTYHPPRDNGEIEAYTRIREAGKEFAKVVLDCTPPCPDQTVAIRRIRETVMIANAAVACKR